MRWPHPVRTTVEVARLWIMGWVMMSIWMMGENRKSDLMTDDAMPFFFKGFSVLLPSLLCTFCRLLSQIFTSGVFRCYSCFSGFQKCATQWIRIHNTPKVKLGIKICFRKQTRKSFPVQTSGGYIPNPPKSPYVRVNVTWLREGNLMLDRAYPLNFPLFSSVVWLLTLLSASRISLNTI